MERRSSVKIVRGFAIALPALVIVAGCAARRPVAEMAKAEQAIDHAQTTSEANLYAPVELTSAEAKLALARSAMARRDYDSARRLAEQALAEAQLAEAKAESQVARAQATRTRQDIQALQVEAMSPDTVVIEHQTTVQKSAPSTVVVERPAPPPAAVIVERPAPPPVVPTTVIVERPAPATHVVTETEEAVVVVPER